MSMPTTFSIGTLSRRTGVNIETIRYYERSGLLPEPERTTGGYRIYGAADAERLVFIRRARDLRFSIDDARRLLGLAEQKSRSCGAVRALASGHLTAIRAKIADLRRMEKMLAAMVAECGRGAIPECPLLETLARR